MEIGGIIKKNLIFISAEILAFVFAKRFEGEIKKKYQQNK